MELKQIRIDGQRLFRINNGHNFYNLKHKDKKYFIEVMLESTIDLLNKDESIIVKTDLPIKSSDWRYEREFDIVDFLKEIKDFVKKPFIKINTANRKNTISSWKLGDIEDNFRNENLNVSDLKIVVGELAKNKLKYNFEKKIKEILALQKTATDKRIQERVNRFFELKEKILFLEDFVGKSKNDYYNSYDRKKDDTIKLSITTLEFNQQLKEIEKEIKGIAKELNIERIGDFDYLPIQKEISYDEWLKINKDDLKENFEECNDESEYKNFNEYAKEMYEEFGGVIEVEWKG